MLDSSPDTEAVRQWLIPALTRAAARGITHAELARACDVRPQAVTGWVKTGRISKRNLDIVRRLLGGGPEFVQAVAAHEPPATYATSLDELITQLGLRLAAVPPARRPAVGTVLQSWAHEGGADHWRAPLLSLLAPDSGKQPAAA